LRFETREFGIHCQPNIFMLTVEKISWFWEYLWTITKIAYDTNFIKWLWIDYVLTFFVV
jgi:hypothetical protein